MTDVISTLTVLLSIFTIVDSKCSKDGNDLALKYLQPLVGQVVTITKLRHNTTYEYKLGICTDVIEDDHISHAGVIENISDNEEDVIVGRYNDSTIIRGSHWILLTYYGGHSYSNSNCSEQNRHAAIMFTCSHQEDGEKLNSRQVRIIDDSLSQGSDCYYLFEIEHCAACISDGCNAFFHQYSPGTIILISACSICLFYLLVGWVYTRCFKGKRGWKQIPNYNFWKEIGGLQADGCNLVCRCGKQEEDQYQRVAGGDSDYNSSFPAAGTSLLSEDEGMLET